jgi:hypothetical protein
MNKQTILTHQSRLEIVFRLKLEVLRDVMLGKYKVSPKDIINLVSDLIEIIKSAKEIEAQRGYLTGVYFPL